MISLDLIKVARRQVVRVLPAYEAQALRPSHRDYLDLAATPRPTLCSSHSQPGRPASSQGEARFRWARE